MLRMARATALPVQRKGLDQNLLRAIRSSEDRADQVTHLCLCLCRSGTRTT